MRANKPPQKVSSDSTSSRVAKQASLPQDSEIKGHVEEKSPLTSSHFDSGYCSSIASSTLDSGLIPDVKEEESPYTTAPPALPSPSIDESGSKHFDSGVDINVSETISSEHLSSFDKKHTAQSSSSLQPMRSKINLDSWRQLFQYNEDYDTPLHLYIGFKEIDKALNVIRVAPHPEFLNLSDLNYRTPLHLACLTDQERIVRRLIVSGVNVDCQDMFGNTPFHNAAALGHLKCLEAMLTPVSLPEIAEARSLYTVKPHPFPTSILNIRNYEGETCVHLAAINNHPNILRYLHKRGADMTAKEGKAGKTPLHYAVASGFLEVTHTLLAKCKVDPNIANYAGLTPLDELERSGRNHRQIKELLTSFGAASRLSSSDDSESDTSEEEDSSPIRSSVPHTLEPSEPSSTL